MRKTLCLITVVLAGCQTYDFEQVEPLTYRRLIVPFALKGSRADVMLLLDRSGSMGFPIDVQNPACTNNCGSTGAEACPAACPTRITELKAAMPVFLSSAKANARFGLTLFPEQTEGMTTQAQCLPASTPSLVEPLPADGPDSAANLDLWATQAERISTYITGTLKVGGGTPTGQSLDFVGTTQGLATASPFKRKRVVLLLTDGLPNCRAPELTADDAAKTVQAVEALATQGVSTIVIGFGSTAQGATVLNDMAKAGGFARNCKQGRSCGADDACDANQQCGRAAYSAGNATELKQVLEELRGQIGGTVDPCLVELGNTEYSNVFVTLNNKLLPEGPTTWARAAANSLQFTGEACQAILDSSEAQPVDLEIGYW